MIGKKHPEIYAAQQANFPPVEVQRAWHGSGGRGRKREGARGRGRHRVIRGAITWRVHDGEDFLFSSEWSCTVQYPSLPSTLDQFPWSAGPGVLRISVFLSTQAWSGGSCLWTHGLCGGLQVTMSHTPWMRATMTTRCMMVQADK